MRARHIFVPPGCARTTHLAFFVIGALALSLSTVASAQERSLRIRDLSVVLTVNSDGSLDVTEHWTYRFTGRWYTTVGRNVWLRHTTAEGRRSKLEVSALTITNGEGQWLQTGERIHKGNLELRIWFPLTINADREVIIRYRVANAIRFFRAGSEKGLLDELYWHVNDAGYPIDRADVVVELPTGVVPSRTAVYYTAAGVGIPGFDPVSSVPADAKIQTNGDKVGISFGRDLSAQEVLTIAVGWPAGHVARPVEAPEPRGITVIWWWPLLIPMTIFVVAFTTWHRRGRDPSEGSHVVYYEPVEGMSPAELGTLVDNEVNGADLTATLIDLAVRGFLRIEETAESNLVGLGKRVDHIIHIVRKRPEWSGLKLHEQRFLTALSRAAGASDMVKSSSLRDKIVWSERILDPIYDGLIASGYYRNRPDQTKTFWIGMACLCIIFGTVFARFAFRHSSPMISPVAVTTAAVLSTLILFGFAPIMPARTAAGARAREAALGFKEFLTRVQDPRNKVMALSPQMFDRFLPYAVALGVAGKWAKAFDAVYREPPQWYVGGTGEVNAATLASSMSRMSSGAPSSGSPRGSAERRPH